MTMHYLVVLFGPELILGLGTAVTQYT